MKSLSLSALARRLFSSLCKRETFRDRVGNVHGIKASQLLRRSPSISRNLITVLVWRQQGWNERKTGSHLRSSPYSSYISMHVGMMHHTWHADVSHRNTHKWFRRNSFYEAKVPQLQDSFSYLKRWEKYPKIARNPKARFPRLQIWKHELLASSEVLHKRTDNLYSALEHPFPQL